LFDQLALRDGLAGILFTCLPVDSYPGCAKLTLSQHLAQIVHSSYVIAIPADESRHYAVSRTKYTRTEIVHRIAALNHGKRRRTFVAEFFLVDSVE
jgi:hypothetical protein